MDDPVAYRAEGILYFAPNARFDFLLNLSDTGPPRIYWSGRYQQKCSAVF
jgi:hypothetical protein